MILQYSYLENSIDRGTWRGHKESDPSVSQYPAAVPSFANGWDAAGGGNISGDASAGSEPVLKLGSC